MVRRDFVWVDRRTTHWVLSTIRDPNRMDLDEARRLTNIYVPIEPVAYKPARVKMVRSRLEKSRLVKKFKPKVRVPSSATGLAQRAHPAPWFRCVATSVHKQTDPGPARHKGTIKDPQP